MGNLCSSGPELVDNQEDIRLPGRSEGGEDESLLTKDGARGRLMSEDVDICEEAEVGSRDFSADGTKGHGRFCGTVVSGESAFTVVTRYDNCLDRTRSLLETRGVYTDALKLSKVGFANRDFHENDYSDNPDGAESTSHEAAARKFVDIIIERATSIVNEQQNEVVSEPQNEVVSEPQNNVVSAPQNEVVGENYDRCDPFEEGEEETQAPKKRWVMFISPQMSVKSSSSLSSPPEYSPPPESDQVSVSSSSISHDDLTERRMPLSPSKILMPASPSVEKSASECCKNIISGNEEEDDDSIKRVALEITTTAMQDAIKIVTNDGAGPDDSPSSVLDSDRDICSQDDELNVSSRSKAELNEIASTATATSVADPGYSESVFAESSTQDSFSRSLTKCAPLAVISAVDNTVVNETTSQSTTEANGSGHFDLVKGHELSTHPAPQSNPACTDTYPIQPAVCDDQQNSNINSSNYPTYSSKMSSCFHLLHELSSSPNMPTIVIKSPDSADYDTELGEDVSSNSS